MVKAWASNGIKRRLVLQMASHAALKGWIEGQGGRVIRVA